MKELLSVVLLLTLSVAANAQAQKEIYQFSKDIEAKIAGDTLPVRYQLGATDYSVSQYHQKAQETWDIMVLKTPTITREDSLFFSTFRPQDAKKYIVERSKRERIVIINEVHHNIGHRVFTTSLLKELYKNGYRFLGLEALFDTLVNQRKFVNNKSGYYTNEPQMANLINEAVAVGFTVFGYEASYEKRGKDREVEEAQNIAKMVSANPNAKFLIHCGYGHVVEGTPGIKSWEKAMAGWLKEMTHIDPFTIDQTAYSERSSISKSSPYIPLVGLDYPVVMVDSKGKAFNGSPDSDDVDCRIISSVTRYVNGRPSWLALSGERSYYKVPEEKIAEYPALVMAYNKGQYEKNGIPCDIIEVLNADQQPYLVLKKGAYTVVVKDKSYRVTGTYEMRVK